MEGRCEGMSGTKKWCSQVVSFDFPLHKYFFYLAPTPQEPRRHYESRRLFLKAIQSWEWLNKCCHCSSLSQLMMLALGNRIREMLTLHTNPWFLLDTLIKPIIIIKGTVSRYCTCTKLWFLDRMSWNQKMPGEWENLETSVCIALGQVQYYTKPSQYYRSMIYCSC